MMSIAIVTPSSDADLENILALQEKNHASVLSENNALHDGFLTVRHTLPMLQKMNAAAPQVLAKDRDAVVGYALVMPVSFQDMIPVLKPMFAMFREIPYGGKMLSEYNYYVMGQICVADGYRGQGIFDALYAKHRALYNPQYELCVTEVSTRNQRSMNAHTRVGFAVVHTFRDETDAWNVMVWDWRK